MKYSILLYLVTIIIAVKGDNDNSTEEIDGKIVGGYQTDITFVPYQVALLNNYGGVFCGGSIISQWWIITAAHCVRSENAGTIRIRAGSSDYTQGGSTYYISQIYSHPSYNPQIEDYDIALLSVSSSFNFGSGVQAVMLPPFGQFLRPPPTGTQMLASGWGYPWAGGSSPQYLHAVTVTVNDFNQCSWSYPTLTDRMICASDAGRDTCQADSGGPLVVNNYLYGVTSFGNGCATPGYPGVYANVANYNIRAYINQITGL